MKLNSLLIMIISGVGIHFSPPPPVSTPEFYIKEFTVTGYCKCKVCCGKWSNVYPRKTANGHLIKSGDKFVAAPKEFPFNTVMEIPGYGKVKVLDRGGAIKGNKLDVFFPIHKEALKWGVKKLKVKIYGNQSNQTN